MDLLQDLQTLRPSWLRAVDSGNYHTDDDDDDIDDIDGAIVNMMMLENHGAIVKTMMKIRIM